jgi:hypothetical protein
MILTILGIFSCRHTCIYLACKVEEFNVSLLHFVQQIKGDRQHIMDVILTQELLLMRLLSFHLTVHHAFRPLEGLIIDLKVGFVEELWNLSGASAVHVGK